MSATVQFRPHKRDLGTVMREVDKNLAIFLGLCSGENQRNDSHHPIEELSEFNISIGHAFGYEISTNTMNDVFSASASQSKVLQIQDDDDFLNLDVDRIDSYGNVTLPDPPLPPIEVVVQQSLATLSDISKCEDISPVHKHVESNIEEYAPVDNNLLQPATPTSIDSPASARRKPIPGTRKPTPTTRPTLPAKLKPSYKPTSTTAQARSSNLSKSTPRSSTPTGPHLGPIISKSVPRSFTPVHKPISSSVSAGGQSSSAGKKDSTVLKNPLVSSRPAKYSNGLSQPNGVTENAKSFMPKRPTSASRPRPSVIASCLSSPNSKQVKNMNSPPSVNSNNGVANENGMSRIQRSNNGSDIVNPVLIGSKMVERMVNVRKLAPPTQDGKLSHDNKPFREKSGFGRSLSKKSLDMALRHMDISRSIPDKI